MLDWDNYTISISKRMEEIEDVKILMVDVLRDIGDRSYIGEACEF